LKIGVLCPYSGDISLRVAGALLINALSKEDADAVVAISRNCTQMRLTGFAEQYYFESAASL
jgi:hypothetical protein